MDAIQIIFTFLGVIGGLILVLGNGKFNRAIAIILIAIAFLLFLYTTGANLGPINYLFSRLISNISSIDSLLNNGKTTISPSPETKTNEIDHSQSEFLVIPAYMENGVLFEVPADGLFSFEIIEGAYSPYANEIVGDNKWRTLLKIYKNRKVDWDIDEYGFNIPSNEDFKIGSYESKNIKTQEQAENIGQGDKISIDLNKGDYLVFVTIDERGSYSFDGKNRGEIVIGINTKYQ